MTDNTTHHVNESADYKDPETMRELYVNRRMTTVEMADIFDCTPSTVSRWLKKHGIETRSKNDYEKGAWEDKELVNRLYHEKEMSAPEIADELGCSVGPIYERLEDVRSIGEANKVRLRREPARFFTTRSGYERVGTKIDGEVKTVAHHRLIAVAEYGFDALCDRIVHHKNGIPFDNRPSNLELMRQSDHVREHFEEIPPHEKAAVYALMESSDMKTREIAEMFDINSSTVTSIAKRIRDGDYPVEGVKA